MRKILLIIAAGFLFSSCNQTEKESADKIYINAKIWTGDNTNPWADAIAIKGSDIVYVGKKYDKKFDSLWGDSTKIISLDGKLMLPGFIDNHTRFLSGGYNLSAVDLRK